MKKLLPRLLGVTLLLNSCIKDDMDACAGYMHIYFSYIYGGANRFFETGSTPTQLHFYIQKHKYRELEIAVDEIGLTEPYRFLKNYDDCATKTGDGPAQPYDEVATSFLFKTSAGNILFLGDTWYNDGYVAIGQKYDIDVAIFDIGWNEPGAFDKMTPYEGARLGSAF